MSARWITHSRAAVVHICEAESFPVAVRIEGYLYFPATEEGLMRAVAMQPVMVDVYCNDAFMEFRGARNL